MWPIDRTLSGATTLGLSESGSDANEGINRIPQSSSIIEAFTMRLFSVIYRTLVEGSYSTAPADWPGTFLGALSEHYIFLGNTAINQTILETIFKHESTGTIIFKKAILESMLF